SERDVAVAHATYCGEVTMVDSWVGRLLEKIELVGIADETLVVFASDHGFYFGEHGYLGKSVWVEEARTQTWSPLYGELTRIPLVVRMPGLRPGRASALTTAADLAPTLLELAGLPPLANATGRSFADVLARERDDARPFVISSWPLGYQKGRISVAVDSWPRTIARDLPLTVTSRTHSLIVGGPDDPVQLYDLTGDPAELNDVATEYAALAGELLEGAIEELRREGAADELLRPREEALQNQLS
ncbi:MAG TPA: sulfatase-like hydrolase/transferase, partial [Gaiellaceae bacterium]|nr:sulfatase-like hydrolase/transferase [Gaiellaceae bacterium]